MVLRMKTKLIILVCMLLFLPFAVHAAPCEPETIVINGTNLWDAWVYSYTYLDWHKNNYGAYNLLQLGTRTASNNAYCRSFFKPVLTDIPTGAAVLDAELDLYIYGNNPSSCSVGTLSLMRVLAGDWIEGTKNAEQAVWPEISWYNMEQYLTLGADEMSFVPVSGAHNRINITQWIRQWASGDWNNFGFLLRYSLEGTSSQCVVYSPSKEYSGTEELNSRRPSITVTYQEFNCVGCVDADGDGYGDGTAGNVDCPAGTETDCDDNNPHINPGAAEICDGIDNNCNGLVDEGFDEDEDGVADCFDDCPGSRPNEPVDAAGCDPFQFCGKFYCSMSCFTADFLDNEDARFPHDCIVVVYFKDGQHTPACLPTTCLD
jgi:hypothetical protein